jgi:hypothetical protein
MNALLKQYNKFIEQSYKSVIFRRRLEMLNLVQYSFCSYFLLTNKNRWPICSIFIAGRRQEDLFNGSAASVDKL